MMQRLKIGTRGSRLALWQANWIKDLILLRYPETLVELVIIKTQGDQVQDRPLAQIGGKGLFVKELETAILNQDVDIAVHSMKDVPAHLPEGLQISVITEREDPADALVAPNYKSLGDLPQFAIIGTSSLRRMAQLKNFRSDLNVKMLRGNVDTRLKKVQNGEYHAAVMACAGLKRLEFGASITQRLDFEIMLPAIAQGAVGIESRINDERVENLIRHLHHQDTALCIIAERSALMALEGNCQVPIGGYCQLLGTQLHLTLLLALPDGTKILKHQAQDSTQNSFALGQSAALWLLDHGGREIQLALGDFQH